MSSIGNAQQIHFVSCIMIVTLMGLIAAPLMSVNVLAVVNEVLVTMVMMVAVGEGGGIVREVVIVLCYCGCGDYGGKLVTGGGGGGCVGWFSVIVVNWC